MILDTHANTFGLPPSLITPIAAKSIDAIMTYVGTITDRLPNNSAFALDFSPLEIANNLEVWNHNRAYLINSKKQIWTHVDYGGYRSYYIEKLNYMDLSNCVIDHIMNRRFARFLGYEFIRLVHVSRGANSSSGRGPENEGVKYQASGNAPKNRQSVISYADPSDLVKMLDIKTGAFPLDSVRDAMSMFYP
jgi:hypothetical protein